MISLLIVSDIHATSKDLDHDGNVSWMSTLPIYNVPTRNPFLTIPALLSDEQLSVDYLICPGDLADCADPVSQSKTWEHLENLKNKTGARRLIATVGNHDVDSRLKQSDFDPKSNLQNLVPPFPGLDESQCDFFWSRNFAIMIENDIRFVIINSCAFHGVHSDDKTKGSAEYIHGRVSDQTINALFAKLNSAKCKMNVLLVHHHIYKNEHISSDDYSEMTGGQKLIRKLTGGHIGPWLIIHGHQHYPDLFYALGGANSPTVLSAGSMSRRLTGQLASRALNQIYHLEIPIESFEGVGWKPLGFARAWDWIDQVGWRRTSLGNSGASIPYGAGFGCRKDPQVWAKEIKQEVLNAPGRRLEWNELLQKFPALKYVLPDDLRAVVDHLKMDEGAHTLYDTDGYPAQVGLK